MAAKVYIFENTWDTQTTASDITPLIGYTLCSQHVSGLKYWFEMTALSIFLNFRWTKAENSYISYLFLKVHTYDVRDHKSCCINQLSSSVIFNIEIYSPKQNKLPENDRWFSLMVRLAHALSLPLFFSQIHSSFTTIGKKVHSNKT